MLNWLQEKYRNHQGDFGYVAIHPKADEVNLLVAPQEKVQKLPKKAGFILWVPKMFVRSFMVNPLVDVQIITDIAIHRANHF